MCMVDHLTYLLNHWINLFGITLVICTTQWLRVENYTHCSGEETSSKCLPSVYPKI